MSETKKYLLLSIKLILVISIINGISNHLWHLVSTNIFLLILVFAPQIVKKYEIRIPSEFEWIILVFSITTIFLGKAGGIITPIIFGVAIAIIGFMVLSMLYSSHQIKKNHFLITLFSFTFAVSLGFIIEITKYYLKLILNQPISSDLYAYSMQTMSFVIIGALISSSIGYIYMKYHLKIIGDIVTKITEKNPVLFDKSEEIKKEISELIKKGENENLEFKSTLRTNLYTNEIDRKIEYSVLKTIAAFMNSQGGTLIIGVSDSGEIIGIEKDKFQNKDAYSLHLTNILKTKIGKKFFSLINFKFSEIEDKTLLIINCEKSNTPVFLKSSIDEEEFYIRTGPSSVQIKGSELIDYIDKNFNKK